MKYAWLLIIAAGVAAGMALEDTLDPAFIFLIGAMTGQLSVISVLGGADE